MGVKSEPDHSSRSESLGNRVLSHTRDIFCNSEAIRQLISIYHNDVPASQRPHRKVRVTKGDAGSCNKVRTIGLSKNRTRFRPRARGMEDGFTCCMCFACFGTVRFPPCQVDYSILILVIDSILGMLTRNRHKLRLALNPRTFNVFMLWSKRLLKKQRALRL